LPQGEPGFFIVFLYLLKNVFPLGQKKVENIVFLCNLHFFENSACMAFWYVVNSIREAFRKAKEPTQNKPSKYKQTK